MGSHVALVKGNRQMGFQVDRATHISLVLKKEIARWDLKLTKERKRKKKKKHLEFFFTKLTMRNIEEFCFVSIVKRGHLLLPNF
jgi:hypothetical protein